MREITKSNVKQKWLDKKRPLFIILFLTMLWSYAQTEKKSMLYSDNNLILSDITVQNDFNIPINTGYITNGLDEDCNQITPSNGVENGYGNLHLLEFANDIEINAGESFVLDSLDFNYMVEPGSDIISADITFYEDSNGKPGAEISSITELDPSSTTSIGSEFGFDVKNAVFEFEEEVEFEGQAGEAIYWVGIQIEYNGENSYMEVTTNMNTPNEIYYYDSDQSRWVGSSEPDADGGFDEAADGVIAFYGECIELEGCSGEPEAGEIA